MKVRLKISIFAVKITDFSPEKFSQQYISPQLILQYWVLIDQTEVFNVRILLESYNDTTKPEVLEVWSLEVGQGLGRMEISIKEAENFSDFKITINNGISKTVILAKFSLTDLSENANYQNYPKTAQFPSSTKLYISASILYSI